ncbi:MAG: CsbD family protein [Actinomycetota bacterium]
MGGNTDKVKGRVKETVGALTGSKQLQRDGRSDERVGRTKQKVDNAIDLVRDKLENVTKSPSPSKKEK